MGPEICQMPQNGAVAAAKICYNPQNRVPNSNMSVKIVQLKKADTAAVRDLNHLMTQLRKNSSECAGTLSELRNIVNSKNAVMIAAKDGKRIIGAATLYIIIKIGRKNGTIEDVVVDSAYRGRGIGKKVVQKIIRAARAKKLRALHLTSRPSRVAANKLYRKLGFKPKKTNPYVLYL